MYFCDYKKINFMIIFPNAKINLGLSVIRKREDGYHDLETVFYPVGLSDILEVLPNETGECRLFNHGAILDCNDDDNLVVKAYKAVKQRYDIPGVDIHLKKLIPSGAGLGGGSSDASFTIIALNNLFSLSIPEDEMIAIASTLGADCPFFCVNKPVYAQGTGNLFTNVNCDLSDYRLVIVKPDVFVSTKDAFADIKPSQPELSVKEIVEKYPVEQWKDLLKNDFETTVFKKHPSIAVIKDSLYELGALYASMSGSGSSLFGIFPQEINLSESELKGIFSDSFVWIEE